MLQPELCPIHREAGAFPYFTSSAPLLLLVTYICSSPLSYELLEGKDCVPSLLSSGQHVADRYLAGGGGKGYDFTA